MGLKTFNNIKTDANAIVNEINASQILKATLTNIQKEKKMKSISLKLPGKTRWSSMIFCAESLLANKFALKTLAISENVERYLKIEVRQIILDDKFWYGLQSLHEILTPIVKWITILEGDDVPLSLVPKAFSEIMNSLNEKLQDSPFSIEEDENIRTFLQEQSLFSMRSIHYAANILDPKFNGQNLTVEQQLKGMEFIHNRVTYLYGNDSKLIRKVLTDLAEYRSDTGVYSSTYLQSIKFTISPEAWWKSYLTETQLSIVARGILTMPATSAATERSFSTYGKIHSIIRNRLTVKLSGKLTYVGYNLKLLKSKDKRQKQRRLRLCSEYWNETDARENTEESENWSEHSAESDKSCDEALDDLKII